MHFLNEKGFKYIAINVGCLVCMMLMYGDMRIYPIVRAICAYTVNFNRD